MARVVVWLYCARTLLSFNSFSLLWADLEPQVLSVSVSGFVPYLRSGPMMSSVN